MKKELLISGISALVIGLIHYAAHTWISPKVFPNNNPVMVVGTIVVLSVFLIGYFGMTKK